MTPEAQRIAIAVACGWTDTQIIDGKYGQTDVPDYLNDLNAMHDAEKMLKGGMRSKYDAELTLISSRDYNFIWESTASQRAEAFLRTIGKWEEAK
jgi:hypothetical protein